MQPSERVRTSSACAALILVSALMVPGVPAVAAQRRETAPQTEAPRPIAIEERDAGETREKLFTLLRQYPPSLAQVLKLDPTLLSNADYLQPYPALAAFLAQHPEVAHNPSYFIGAWRIDAYDTPGSEKRMVIEMWEGMMAGLAGFAGALIMIGVLGWLIRTLIDYRRWLRLSKIQTEVHTKLLDRFSANEDLIAYIQTTPGRRFLESAPIPIEEGPRSIAAPVGRILWSVQAGVVLAMGGAGLWYVSGRVIEEMREPLFVIGSLAVALGVGFIVSAVIAFMLTRQMGLLAPRERRDAAAPAQT